MLALHMPGVGKDGNAQLIPKIKANGWDGGIISVPFPNDPNPASKVFKDRILEIKQQVKAVLAATGAAAIRISAFIPVDATGWQKLAQGPRSSYGPYNPDPGMWDAQVECEKAIYAALKAACDEIGLRYSRIIVEKRNESGVGGVNGPLTGKWSDLRADYEAFKQKWAASDHEAAKALWLKVFLPWTWNDGPLPEGWIPEQTWAYLKYIRSKAGLGGLRGIGYTSEASAGDTGETELESMSVSATALAYLDLFEFPLAVNHYSKSVWQWVAQEKRFRNLTPIESASEWSVRLRAKCDRARSLLALYMRRPYLLDHIPCMEAGFWLLHCPKMADGSIDTSRVDEYRQAYVDRMQMVVGDHPFIGYYTGVSPDPTSNGVHLYVLQGGVLSAVGGEVGPKLDYDGSLESVA